MSLLQRFGVEMPQNLSEGDRMLLEKRALWLRKEQARKKQAAEVQHLTPNFTTATKYSLT
jgi:hypothetical protein